MEREGWKGLSPQSLLTVKIQCKRRLVGIQIVVQNSILAEWGSAPDPAGGA